VGRNRRAQRHRLLTPFGCGVSTPYVRSRRSRTSDLPDP
jgi:hypothetical protein